MIAEARWIRRASSANQLSVASTPMPSSLLRSVGVVGHGRPLHGRLGERFVAGLELAPSVPRRGS